MTRFRAGLAVAVCFFGAAVAAQQPVFRGSGDVVRVFSTVTDRDGRLVPTLGRDDFEVRDGAYVSAAAGFDQGRFVGRNLWDRRYPVVDTERGIVLSIVRFGMKDGMKSQSVATSNDRLVAEFFAVKNGMIQEVHAVLFNLPDAQPTGWEPQFGPGRGGS